MAHDKEMEIIAIKAENHRKKRAEKEKLLALSMGLKELPRMRVPRDFGEQPKYDH